MTNISIDRDTAEQILATIRDSVPWVTRREQRAALDMAGHRLSGFIELTYQEDGQVPLFSKTEGKDMETEQTTAGQEPQGGCGQIAVCECGTPIEGDKGDECPKCGKEI